MKIVVAKVLCLLGICVLMLVGSLLPVKIIEADYEKAHRSKKVLALCNSFGGGVFLATCFNALLPAVREKVTASEPLSYEHFQSTGATVFRTPVQGKQPPCSCPAGHQTSELVGIGVKGLCPARAAHKASSEMAVPGAQELCPSPIQLMLLSRWSSI